MVPRLPARLAFLVLAALPASNLHAQESKAYFDAPVAVADWHHRFETVVDLNGDGFADALSIWWEYTGNSYLNVRPFINDQHGALNPGISHTLPFVESFPQADSPWHVATGDFSGDGLPEVLVGMGSFVHMLRSGGGGALQPQTPPVLILSGGYVDGVLVDDFDGDGALDVAVLNGTLTLYHVDPVTLTLTAFSSIPTATHDAQLHPVEMNGDGVPDLMVTDATNVLLYPVVAGQLQPPMVFPHQCGSPKPAAGDIDGDGDVDVVVWDMGQYTVLRRTSATTFAAEYGKVGGPARFLYDLDGDGDLDGVCCGGGGPSYFPNDQVSVFRLAFNDGHGNFAPAQEMPGLGSFKLAGAADLDHDGDLDLVAGRCVFYAHGPWKRTAAPTFTAHEPRPGALVDFDGDGDVDLGLGIGGVSRNLGDGRPQTFAPHMPPAPAGETWSNGAYSGDFDGDGDADMIVSSYKPNPPTSTLWLLTNDGGGSFTNSGNVLPPGTTMGPFGSGPEDSYSFTADVDGDGDIDIVAGTQYDDDTRIWVNDGQGHFALSALIHPGHIQKVVDLNGDGIPDLIGHYLPFFGSVTETEATWRGLGNGSFAAAQPLTVRVHEINPTVAIADVFGEGDNDILLGDSNGVLHLLANNLNGGVTSLGPNQFVDYEFQGMGIVLDSASTVTAFDVDGDGRDDIVASSPGFAPGASYVILRRHDNLGWEAPVIQVLRAPVAADMDGDGDIDAVGTNVWLNTRISGPNASSCVQTVSGTPDPNGLIPTLGGKGPFHVGSSVDLRLTGAPPQTNGVIVVSIGSLSAVPFATQFTSYSVRSSMLIHLHTSGTPGMAGTGAWRLPFTVPAYTAGTTRTYEALLPNPLVQGGFVRSNRLEIHYVP